MYLLITAASRQHSNFPANETSWNFRCVDPYGKKNAWKDSLGTYQSPIFNK